MSARELQVKEKSQVEGDICVEHGTRHGDEGHAGHRPAPVRLATGLIHAYQTARSGRPTGCRYLPSCSEYAIEAIEVHGPARGSLLAARRIARCGPWGGHGVDPVPERSTP